MQQRKIKIIYSEAVLEGFRNRRRKREAEEKKRFISNLSPDDREIEALRGTLKNFETACVREWQKKEVADEISKLHTILDEKEPPRTRKHTFARRFWWVSRKILEPPKAKKVLRACFNGLLRLVAKIAPCVRSLFWKKSSCERLSNDLLEKVTPICFKRRATI